MTSRTQDNSYPGQLIPTLMTTRTRDRSYLTETSKMNLTFPNDRNHGLYNHRQEFTKILDDLSDVIGKYDVIVILSGWGRYVSCI